MDRQTGSNMHVSQAKSLATTDSLPTTSRQGAKNFTNRPNNNKQCNNKNGFSRFTNKQPRGRESKSLAQHLRDSVESNRNYLDESKHSPLAFRKKNVNIAPKVSLKERFVQANCQFVMSFTNDNSRHLKDPDSIINWDLVEEVLFTCTNTELCCPICLCEPTAAKISRCGHIYCWSCILHYLALSDKDSRSCPICFEKIKKNELKSVSVINKIDYTPNHHLTFSLMRIRKNSTVALPVTCKPTEDMHRLKRNVNQTLDQFGKIFTASSDYTTEIVEREMKELEQQLLEYQMENMPEVCFVHSAFEELEKRRVQLVEISSLCESFADVFLQRELPLENDDYIYFYQSDDGQAIYLHPLNIRMLRREYGELKNCPLSITARIIELHGQSVNEELRRRNAHLRHLPISCEFKVAEVEFDTSVVSAETLSAFSSEINNRKKNRKRKERVQNIRDRKIEIENNRKIYGISSAPSFQLNTTDFPNVYQMENDDALLANESDPILNNDAQLGSSPTSDASGEFQSSFAKMLSAGGNNFDRTLRKQKPSSTSEQTFIEKPADDDEDGVQIQPMNITLGDFFDTCVKTSRKGKKAKKRINPNDL